MDTLQQAVTTSATDIMTGASRKYNGNCRILGARFIISEPDLQVLIARLYPATKTDKVLRNLVSFAMICALQSLASQESYNVPGWQKARTRTGALSIVAVRKQLVDMECWPYPALVH